MVTTTTPIADALKLIYLVTELGEYAIVPDGAVVQIGGVVGPNFTVGGKPLLFADGTSTDGSSTGNLTRPTLQTVYNNSVGEGFIDFTSGKDLVLQAVNSKQFRFDADTGDVTISGNLVVQGETTTVINAAIQTDRVAIHQTAGNYVPFIMEPLGGVTPAVNVVDIKVARSGSSVFTIGPTGETYIQTLTTGLINGVDIAALADTVGAHLTNDGQPKHAADEISVDDTDLDPITGTNVQEALASIAEIVNTLTSVGTGGDVRGYEHTQLSPSSTWMISHNQATKRVHLTIWDELDEQLWPDSVSIFDQNTVVVTFSTPIVGRAVLMLFGGTATPPPDPDPDPVVHPSIQVQAWMSASSDDARPEGLPLGGTDWATFTMNAQGGDPEQFPLEVVWSFGVNPFGSHGGAPANPLSYSLSVVPNANGENISTCRIECTLPTDPALVGLVTHGATVQYEVYDQEGTLVWRNFLDRDVFLLQAEEPPVVQTTQPVFVNTDSAADLGEEGRLAMYDGGQLWQHVATVERMLPNTGTWYFEFEIVNPMATDAMNVGITPYGLSLSPGINSGDGGMLRYFDHGAKRRNGLYEAYGAPWTTGDVIGFLLDTANGGSLTAFKNEVSQGVMYTNFFSANSNEPGVVPGSSGYGMAGRIRIPEHVAGPVPDGAQILAMA